MGIDFRKERLILCEGSMDKTFFCELVRVRGLPDFQVLFPHGANETTGGIDKFHRALFGYAANEEFRAKVRGVLVVADNDSDPATQFARVSGQVAQAGFGRPANELQFALSPDPLPPIAIMMLPLGQQAGNLETVCKQSAFNKWPQLEVPLAEYLAAAPAANWSEGKQDKMRIQCVVAATCEANPYATMATLYQERDDYHIPLDAQCFDDIAQVLRDFDANVRNAR